MHNLILTDGEKQFLLDVLSLVGGNSKEVSPRGIADKLLMRLGNCDTPDAAPWNEANQIVFDDNSEIVFKDYVDMPEDVRRSYGR